MSQAAPAANGNGWVHCRCGHRHWGRYGAAGVLVTDGVEVLLAHRAGWTHQGGSWAIPGGARDRDETVAQAALREAREETTLDTDGVAPFGSWVDDHGDWSYTTVLATVGQRRPVAPATQVGQVHATVGQWQENDAVRWWPIGGVAALHLHPGFAAAWPHLRAGIAAHYGTVLP